MNSLPLVSVIIPTYNRASLLANAIDSVFAQTYTNIELLVIDDGSEDGTADLMKRYPQASFIVQAHAGQATARNTGLVHAKGTIVASLDSDDSWYPEFLERCVAKLLQDDLDFVFANWDQERREGTTWDFLVRDPFLTPYFRKMDQNWVRLDAEELRKIYIGACPSPSSSVVIRKSSIIHGWSAAMNIGDDWLIYLDMIFNKEPKAAFTLERLWRKRLDDRNIYDGRKWSEVLQLLHIDDTDFILQRFSDKLLPRERKVLAERRINAMVDLAKYKAGREYDFRTAYQLLYRSFSINGLYTTQKLGSTVIEGLGKWLKPSQTKVAS